MEGGSEESWHDASEDEWEMACEEAKEEATVEQGIEPRGSAEISGVESRPDQESIWSTFRFGWSAIRTWIVRTKLDRDANQGEEGVGADR